MSEEAKRPKVGVGIVVRKGDAILLSLRKSAHGSGGYAGPGGHLEYLESITDCAKREVEEECGLSIKNIEFAFAANITEFAPKHYLHIGLVADWEAGEPANLEPDKQGPWGWYALDALPEPISPIYVRALENLRTGRVFFDGSGSS